MVDSRTRVGRRGVPLGDGTAETEAVITCPYCGEPNEIALDAGVAPCRSMRRTARCAAGLARDGVL